MTSCHVLPIWTSICNVSQEGIRKRPKKQAIRRHSTYLDSNQGDPVQLPRLSGDVGESVPFGSGLAFHRPYPSSLSRWDGSCASLVRPNRSSSVSSAPDAVGSSTRRCWASHPAIEPNAIRMIMLRVIVRILVLMSGVYTQDKPLQRVRRTH
jgi:hypothetical protein